MENARRHATESIFQYNKLPFFFSITLIGIAVGGLECDLALLLSTIHNAIIFCVGTKELEKIKNIDQLKRDLRQCYPIIDCLLESLDPTAIGSPKPTLLLDLVECILCPQGLQLQVRECCCFYSSVGFRP